MDVDIQSEAMQIVQEFEFREGGSGGISDTESEMSLDGLAEADF